MQTLHGIRSARFTYGTRGTYYAFDGTAPNQVTEDIQRLLGALIALSEPVGTECNEFALSQYHFNFAL